MLRAIICAAITLIVGGALLLFDDVQQGLPILNLAIWSLLLLAGLWFVLRANRRRQRRERRARRQERPRDVLLRAQPMTPSRRLEDQHRLRELPRR